MEVILRTLLVAEYSIILAWKRHILIILKMARIPNSKAEIVKLEFSCLIIMRSWCRTTPEFSTFSVPFFLHLTNRHHDYCASAAATEPSWGVVTLNLKTSLLPSFWCNKHEVIFLFKRFFPLQNFTRFYLPIFKLIAEFFFKQI